MRRVIIAGLAAGVAVFLWSAVAHMALPLGSAGISIFTDEAPVLEALKAHVPKPGLYFFPGMDMSGRATAEEEKAWQEKYRTGPHGILVFHPEGEEPMAARQLGLELAADLVAGLILAGVLALIPLPSLRRGAIAALLGAFAWFSISASTWIWYGFPAAFVLAEAADQVVGWFLASVVAGRILPLRA